MPKVNLDLTALKAAAERKDSTHAMVDRRWLGDVLAVLTGEAQAVLVPADRAPTPMVAA